MGGDAQWIEPSGRRSVHYLHDEGWALERMTSCRYPKTGEMEVFGLEPADGLNHFVDGHFRSLSPERTVYLNDAGLVNRRRSRWKLVAGDEWGRSGPLSRRVCFETLRRSQDFSTMRYFSILDDGLGVCGLARTGASLQSPTDQLNAFAAGGFKTNCVAFFGVSDGMRSSNAMADFNQRALGSAMDR